MCSSTIKVFKIFSALFWANFMAFSGNQACNFQKSRRFRFLECETHPDCLLFYQEEHENDKYSGKTEASKKT